MNDKSTEELMVRWMDGEKLKDEEINVLKKMHAEDPDKLINPKELARIQAGLKATYTSDQDIPNAGKFQSSLMEQIKQEQPTITATSTESAQSTKLESARPQNVESFPTEKSKPRNWLLTGAAMAACFLLGLLVNLAFLGKGKSGNATYADTTTSHSNHLQPVVFSAYENLSADYISENETNVIIIEGLDAIPDDIDLFALADSRKPIKVYPQISYPQYEN